MGKKENTTATTEVVATATATTETTKNALTFGNEFELNNFGFKSSALEEVKKNTYHFNIPTADGKSTMSKDIEVSGKAGEALAKIATVTDLRKLDTIVLAWSSYQLVKVAKNNGFKSIGEMLALNFDGYTPNYINQLKNAAEKFLIDTGNGIAYRYPWCDGIPITNLALVLGRFNDCDGETDSEKAENFYNKYVKPDEEDNVLLPIANQSELKKAISALNEKDGKTTKKKKQPDNKQPELKPEACCAKVIEWFTANSKLDEVQTKTYIDMLNSIVLMMQEAED